MKTQMQVETIFVTTDILKRAQILKKNKIFLICGNKEMWKIKFALFTGSMSAESTGLTN
jgi:hypothetical protein